MDLSRRTLLGAALASPLLTAAAPGRTTVALVPHPDDGVIRLAHYAVRAADRGDRMVLVAAAGVVIEP